MSGLRPRALSEQSVTDNTMPSPSVASESRLTRLATCEPRNVGQSECRLCFYIDCNGFVCEEAESKHVKATDEQRMRRPLLPLYEV